MPMKENYLNEVAAHGASLISHIGLVDENGEELSGGDPAYERQEVNWTTPDNGTIRPEVDLVFNIPAGSTVAEWKGFSAATGGEEYGGAPLTQESYNNQGEYKLLAEETGVLHQNAE